jgi:hypothetical protein
MDNRQENAGLAPGVRSGLHGKSASTDSTVSATDERVNSQFDGYAFEAQLRQDWELDQLQTLADAYGITLPPILPRNVGGQFKLVSADDVAGWELPTWLVRGVLPRSGIAAFYGPSGSGKSHLIAGLTLASASGESDWFGHKVSPAPATMVVLEGVGGLSQRVAALEIHHDAPLPDRLKFITEPFNLVNDVPALAAAIIAAGQRDGLVVIDTLNAATPGCDENSGADMSRILAAVKDLQRRCGGLVCLVHHSGKDTSKGLRGHSSLLAALDAAVEVRRDGDQRSWVVTKSKDGMDGQAHPFKLQTIEVGTDEDDDPVTSCVVIPAGDGISHRRASLPKSGNQKIIYDELRTLLPTPASALAPKPTINLDDAIERIKGRLPCEPRRQGERCRAALTGLIARRLVDLTDGYLSMRSIG